MQQRREPFQQMPLPAQLREAVLANTNYRQVLFTDTGDANGNGATQLVAMSLGYNAADKNRSLGWEVHPDTAQYFAVEGGEGMVWVGKSEEDPHVRAQQVSAVLQSKWLVTPGTWHDVTIDDDGHIKLLTIYFPPHHPPGTVDRTLADAISREQSSKAAIGSSRIPLRRACQTCGKDATLQDPQTGAVYCRKECFRE